MDDTIGFSNWLKQIIGKFLAKYLNLFFVDQSDNKLVSYTKDI